MFRKLTADLCRVKDYYDIYRKTFTLAKDVVVQNKRLYQELENACQKNGGVLTYAEYLSVDQFGKNGYYSDNNDHGKTDVDERWGSALAHYCQKFGFERIIEIGCGKGELGIATVEEYYKLTKRQLHWSGVEIDKALHKKIRDNFTEHNLIKNIGNITQSIDELPKIENVLIVFPYALDNIPPQQFVNTHSQTTTPNSMIGLKAANGRLSETLLTESELEKKGMTFKEGLFTQNKTTFDLSQWKLRKGQRAYIAPDVYRIVTDYVKKFGKNSSLIVIDEFRKEPWSYTLENLGIPKSLTEKNLLCRDRVRYYRESGKNNLYYPLYQDTLWKFLSLTGFQSVYYDIEQKIASDFSGKRWIPLYKSYATYAYIATTLVPKKPNPIKIPFTPQRLW